MGKVLYKRAQAQDLEDILEVLRRCELPYSDVSTEKIELFLLAKVDGKVVGTIGLETYGREALLRSMAVLPEYRGKGVATRLLRHILELAKKLGITSLHLLTTTADRYFLKKGFQPFERAQAPFAIQQTTEFAELCPSSSVYVRLLIHAG
jgi:amino-acid N-acetyltransferase